MIATTYTKSERTQKICDYLQNNDKFKKLHDCSERFVYPFIPKDIEMTARENYQIGNDETVLFVQSYSTDLQSSTVITDVAIRVAFECPMNFVFFTWDKKTRWVYNGEHLVYFDDIHKITTPLHISFIYRSPNAMRHEDNFGENVAEIFNQINEWSPENTSDTYNKLVERYISKCKDFDLKNYQSPYLLKLKGAKSALNGTVIFTIIIGLSLELLLAAPLMAQGDIAAGLLCTAFLVGVALLIMKSKGNEVVFYEKKFKDDRDFYQNESLEAYRIRVFNQYEKQKNRAMTQNVRTYIDDLNGVASEFNKGWETGINIGNAIVNVLSVL